MVCCSPGGYLVRSVFCRWCGDGGLHDQNRVLRGGNAQGGWYERRHAHACARVHDRAHTQGSQRQTVTWERVTCHARVTQSGRPWRSGRGRRLRAYSRVASNADFSGKRSIASTTACACRRNCGFCACTSETPGPRWMRTRCVEGLWCKILLPPRRKEGA